MGKKASRIRRAVIVLGLVSILLMAIYSCTSEPRSVETANPQATNNKSNTTSATTQTPLSGSSVDEKTYQGYPPPPEHPREVGVYEYQNDTLLQRLQVKWISEHRIKYVLLVTNTVSNCSTTVSGIAVTMTTGGDPDLDEDDEGIAYPTIYYVSKDPKKPLHISIEMNLRDKAHVYLGNPSWIIKEGCPLESVRLLRVKE